MRFPPRRHPTAAPSLGAGPSADGGASAAELAVVLPAVVLVLGLCLGAVQTVGQQVMLTSAAAEAARTLGRGEDAATATARIAGAAGGAAMSVDRSDRTVCVELSAPSGFRPAGAVGLRVTARGCAWQEQPGAE
jgi:Flp pilus assembly protein TadG